jgi:hypothetical protein
MIFLFLIIFILLTYYFYSIRTEQYQNLNMYPTRLLGIHKFSKLKNGNIVYMDIKPIEPGVGESQCVIKQCPPLWNDNMTCYECL